MYKRYVKQLSRRFCNFFTGQKRPCVAKHSVGAGENICAGKNWSPSVKEAFLHDLAYRDAQAKAGNWYSRLDKKYGLLLSILTVLGGATLIEIFQFLLRWIIASRGLGI